VSAGVFMALAALVLTMIPLRVASAQVRFERTGYRLTSLGEHMAVSARLVDARRRPVANAKIRWRIADSSIASVTPAGIVVSRRPGYTKLWAVAGQDSASALILVDQWAAKFDFSPAIVRFDAVGSKVPLKVLVRDAAGHLIADQNRRTATCRMVNERIATLATNGDVSARANGVTYVRCTDRGIADSVRVEVRQKPRSVVIADKLNITSKMVGDTFKIRLSALDNTGLEIKDVQATWASLNSGVVNVDPLTGFARSVGPGVAKIVAQAGDATDTVSIQVQPSAGMPMPVTVDSTNALPSLDAPRVPTLTLQSLYLMVGDTGRLTATAKDASGNPISNPGLTFRSSDTSVVSPVTTRSGQGWVARRTGVTYVVAQFGTIVDSLQVSVRAKSTATSSGTAAGPSIAFERPKFDTLASRRLYAQRLDSAARAIKRASIVREFTGRALALSAVAGQVTHSSHISDVFTETHTGLLYGGNAVLAPLSWLKLTGDYRTGTLTNGKATGEDMKVNEAEANLMLSPAPWFAFGGGYVMRSEQTDLATQHWTFPRVTAQTRFAFVGGAVTTVTGISLLPGATYTGFIDPADTSKTVAPNPFSLSGEAGLELRTGVLSAALTYYVEKFAFPEKLGSTRADQFSALRLRIGLQAGR
jgi:hypothetical protein